MQSQPRLPTAETLAREHRADSGDVQYGAQEYQAQQPTAHAPRPPSQEHDGDQDDRLNCKSHQKNLAQRNGRAQYFGDRVANRCKGAKAQHKKDTQYGPVICHGLER